MDDILGKLRAFGGLGKVCKLFIAKYEGNSLKAGDRRGLKQAFTAYNTNPHCKDIAKLPWCVSCLELIASVDMGAADVRHPADLFPLDETMRAHSCNLTQWVIFVQDMSLSMGEEMIKVAKATDETLKDFVFFLLFLLVFLFDAKQIKRTA